MAEVIIRDSVKEDMKDVFQLIKDLATYENHANDVTLDHTTLERDGFDTPSPAFRCLVAETTNNTTNKLEIIGYALLYNNYSAWIGKYISLRDIYVKQEFRKCGAGRKLFLSVAKIAEEVSCRMDFTVKAWNQPSIEFYKKFGAVCVTETEDWNLFRLDNEALKKAANEISFT